MGKKRKKSLSEIKSITDGSSSYEGDFPWEVILLEKNIYNIIYIYKIN
jgi:hypothetical protein